MFALIACFPAIKTLDQCDFAFATGSRRKQIMRLPDPHLEPDLRPLGQRLRRRQRSYRSDARSDSSPFWPSWASMAKASDSKTNARWACSGRPRSL